MTRFIIVFAVILLATSSQQHAASLTDQSPNTVEERFSYTLGNRIISRLGLKPDEISAEYFILGLRDFLEGNSPLLSGIEMQRATAEFKQASDARLQVQAIQNRDKGELFLDENRRKDGIVELPSGLQYKILVPGNGRRPLLADVVSVHYVGRLLDGSIFDSSHSRIDPAEFQVGQVIKGWQEALLLMREGAKWQLFISDNLAYGKRGQGDKIGPGETLIFEVELLAIQ